MSHREDLKEVLGLIEVFFHGEPSEAEAKVIEDMTKKINDRLKAEDVKVPEAERFPKGEWVFRVKRVQFTRFSVAAKDEAQAWNRAASRYHDDVEGFRFFWDTSNPLELTPLELERSPE